jgi:DNA-binding NtrC family response regulator
MREDRNVAAENILVVDDDPQIREVLQTRLESKGYRVFTANDGQEALAALKHGESVDLIITDLKMPVMDGLEFMRRLPKTTDRPPVIFLTAHGSVPEAVEAMKLGAYDFLEKPYSGADLLQMAKDALMVERPSPVAVKEATGTDDQLLAGTSAPMKHLMSVIDRIAATPSSVLITGESGTGKELAARTIHARSDRAGAPLVVIDCGALPDTLLESELFGHRKGSFTSATQDKKGLLELADGGTAFLDEIGNISVAMQTRLLRFLQNGEVRRIGDTTPHHVNVRVLAATNLNLAAAVEDGSFRQDLYYRLKVVTLVLPLLSQRRQDIPYLAGHFLEQSSRLMHRPVTRFADGVLGVLESHNWPGNVRELKHVIEAGVALSRGEALELEDLNHSGFIPYQGEPVSDSADDLTSLERLERDQILRALKESSWVQKRAADTLGISGRVIHYKIRKYGIQIPRS